jgi:hypothetical protein
LLAHGRWFSPGTPASSTTKAGRHDIAEILLKVALNTKIKIQIQIISKRACSLKRHLVVCLFCFLRHVSCVPNVARFFWITHFLIGPSVLSNVYLNIID